MNYSPQDYEDLYGDHWMVRSSKRTRILVAVLILGWIGALLLVSGCDGQDAQAHQESIQTASLKKEALMGMPCTWVAVCIHEPCSVLHRKCVNADLTERQ